MSFSDKFLEIMKSNIRPKCEPKITVTGTAADGTTKTLEWNAKDIKSLSFHRSIDPVGRELPIMELSWTEVYYGKFNLQNFPIKYNNVAKYMSVNLEFHQFLGFYRTWKALKSLTWKQVKALTWKKVKNEVAFETIKMPMMFLSGIPEISGHTIKWTAKDALSFLTENQIHAFNIKGVNDTNVPFYNPIVYLLINARGSFTHSKELFDYYTRTINYFNELEKTKKLPNGIIFDGATNSEIMNYLSPVNEYLDFSDDKIVKKQFVGKRNNETTNTDVPLSLQYGNPICEPCLTISGYKYKKYSANISNNTDSVSPSKSTNMGVDTGTGKNVYKLDYLFKGYGKAPSNVQASNINRAIVFSATETDILNYNPIEYNPVDVDIPLSNRGEPYIEDNHLNSYEESTIKIRANNLKDWFVDGAHIIKNTTPALFNWNVGEFANVETQLWDDSTNKNYIAFSLLLEYNIEYNGTIKQSNIAHEMRG